MAFILFEDVQTSSLSIKLALKATISAVHNLIQLDGRMNGDSKMQILMNCWGFQTWFMNNKQYWLSIDKLKIFRTINWCIFFHLLYEWTFWNKFDQTIWSNRWLASFLFWIFQISFVSERPIYSNTLYHFSSSFCVVLNLSFFLIRVLETMNR